MIEFPKHKCGLYLEHNPHKDVYESVAQWLDKRGGEGVDDDEMTPEDRTKAIELDEIWTLQWYPDTPVGFYFVAAPTLERLLERAEEFE